MFFSLEITHPFRMWNINCANSPLHLLNYHPFCKHWLDTRNMGTNCFVHINSFLLVIWHISVDFCINTGSCSRKGEIQFFTSSTTSNYLYILWVLFIISQIRIYSVTTIFSFMWILAFILTQFEQFLNEPSFLLWSIPILLNIAFLIILAICTPSTTRKSYNEIFNRLNTWCRWKCCRILKKSLYCLE